MIRVRPAAVEDLRSVVEIERQCETAPHWSEEEYRAIVSGRSALKRCLLVAEGGFAVGKVVGEEGELESVAVSAAARRRGVGEALCRGVIDWCREEGAEAIDLDVRAGTVGARKLYGKLGFVEVGRRPGYYTEPTEDALLMRFHCALSSDV